MLSEWFEYTVKVVSTPNGFLRLFSPGRQVAIRGVADGFNPKRVPSAI